MAFRWSGRKQDSLKLPNLFKLLSTVPDEAKHKNDVVTMLFHEDRLYTGADDGKVKIWNADLSPVAEIQAHPNNVYSVAILNDTLYSCSSDGTLKSWEMDTWKQKETLVENPKVECIKVVIDNGRVYSGNEAGEIFVWENDKQIATYGLNEDIQDFLVIGNLVYSARNVDVSINEMMGEPRFTYMSRGVMIGRFPIRYVGDKICFLSRCAKNIYVHAAQKEEKFKRIAEIKAHEMTISALSGVPEKPHLLMSGGYDRNLRVWDLNTLKAITQIDVGVCINDICAGRPGEVYVSSSEGYIVRFSLNL